MRWNVVLLGLVVLCTNARNRFCPMCTKGCCMVPTCSKPFWGQFWGQICKTDSHTHQSNKCAALVSLRNTNTLITGFLHRKRPHELMMKFYSLARSCTQAPLHTIPARRPCRREKRPCLGAFAPHRQWGADYTTASQSAPFRGALPLPERLHESSFIFGLCCKPSTQPDDPVRFCRAFLARVSYAHHPDLQRDHPGSKTVSHRQRGHPQATVAYTT